MYLLPSSDSITQAQREILKDNGDKVRARAHEIEKNLLIADMAERLAIIADGNHNKRVACIQVLRNVFNLEFKDARDVILTAFEDYHRKSYAANLF